MAKSICLNSICIAVLVSTGIGLIKAHSMLRIETDKVYGRIEKLLNPQQSWTSSVPVGSQAPSFRLRSIEDNLFVYEQPDALLTMLVFFSMNDCSLCLLESLVWKEIHENYDSKVVRVIGITERTSARRSLLVFARSRKLNFPILVDEDQQVRKSYGITQTPVRILIDKAGRIIDAEASTRDQISHRNLRKKISALLAQDASLANDVTEAGM